MSSNSSESNSGDYKTIKFTLEVNPKENYNITISTRKNFNIKL